ncbi:MAG: DNA-processing protein DprA [Eubacteriales bacterium]|nr:DNA-processing protein DprA [Eubacteriales bacterium]
MRLEDAICLKLWQRQQGIPEPLMNRLFEYSKINEDFDNLWQAWDSFWSEALNRQDSQLGKLGELADSETASWHKSRLLALRDEARRRADRLNPEMDLAISSVDRQYPQRFRQIGEHKPSLFFLRRRSSFEFSNTQLQIAIVGSRRSSAYGHSVVEQALRHLAAFKPLIVSGLALGMDAEAHRVSLRLGIDTLAVVPRSLDDCYPIAHRELKMEIEGLGASLSEFLPGDELRPYHFYQRNRLIAGLADLLLVVEAGAKSGALITANYAAEYGRPVMAVPGSIFSPLCQGCLQLIHEGAEMYRGVDSLIDCLKSLKNRATQPLDDFSPVSEEMPWIYGDVTGLEREILRQLRSGEKTVSMLQTSLQVELSKIHSALTRLQLLRLVRQQRGAYLLTSPG